MEQIQLSKEDIAFLNTNYPELKFDETNNIISGKLSFYRSYNKRPIRGKYSIKFKLEHGKNSFLPNVCETKGKLLSIAKRKKLPPAVLHLNTLKGEMCLIIPIKEYEYYPNGFELKRFLNHLEEHLYWISYFERYDEKPWKDQAHGFDGYVEVCGENKKYRPLVKKRFENVYNKKISRSSFRRFLKKNNLL